MVRLAQRTWRVRGELLDFRRFIRIRGSDIVVFCAGGWQFVLDVRLPSRRPVLAYPYEL